MTPDRFQRARELFEQALELPEAERLAFVARQCGDDRELAAIVRDLLQRARLQQVENAPNSPVAAGDDRLIGAQVGPYRIRAAIGQGGMGAVYEAEHERTGQVVALKLIRPGLATPALLRRFEFELQVLARLEHPGIARIYHADTADVGGGPQPYFAMELVRGLNLVEYAVQQRLPIRQRLELAAKIADAVQYAHQQGVIHRDLKPGNIFVSADGQPKILDFGVARATEDDVQSATLQTDIGQLIGTLPYMSPEQAACDPNQIDTRSDVYALGVVMYELLTGRLPYVLERRMIHEAVRIIKEEEPTRLSSLNKALRGDVETIVGKALQKDKERRYASANALAADIRRSLSDEPVAARPPSTAYQIGKFARRNKVLVAGVAATFVALAAGLVTSIVLYQRAEAEAERAKLAESRERGERERAEKALAEVTKSRDETKKVSDFQSQMLRGLDTTKAGMELMKDVRERFAAALEKAGVPEAERATRAEAFSAELVRVNPTDTAVAMIDRMILRPAVIAIDEQFKELPVVDARLRQVLGTFYESVGFYDAAYPLQESALTTRRRVRGEEHPETISSIDSMSRLLLLQGKLSEAEPYSREALEKSRRILGEEHPDTLGIADNLGMLLSYQNKPAEAESYYREALEKRRRILGDEHPDTIESVNNMGDLLRSWGKLENAEMYLREALEKSRRVLGEEHPRTLATITNIGYVLYLEGKLTEAEPYLREALNKHRRVEGDEHLYTLICISKLGPLLHAQGKDQETLNLLAPAVPAARQAFSGDNVRHLAALLTALGRARVGLGYDAERFKLAESNLLEAHPILVQSRGESHKDTLDCVQGLIDLYAARGAVELDKGYDAKAAEWRAKLEEWQASTQPASTQPAAQP